MTHFSLSALVELIRNLEILLQSLGNHSDEVKTLFDSIVNDWFSRHGPPVQPHGSAA